MQSFSLSFFSHFLLLTQGEKMNNPVKKLAAAGVLGVAYIMGGCSTDSGFHVTVLDVKGGSQAALYRKGDDRSASDREIFQRDCSPFGDSNISDQSGFLKHYRLGEIGGDKQ